MLYTAILWKISFLTKSGGHIFQNDFSIPGSHRRQERAHRAAPGGDQRPLRNGGLACWARRGHRGPGHG